jgi:hypothetical protein
MEGERIGAGIRLEGVVACALANMVVAHASEQMVIADMADDRIVAVTAVDDASTTAAMIDHPRHPSMRRGGPKHVRRESSFFLVSRIRRRDLAHEGRSGYVAKQVGSYRLRGGTALGAGLLTPTTAGP